MKMLYSIVIISTKQQSKSFVSIFEFSHLVIRGLIKGLKAD